MTCISSNSGSTFDIRRRPPRQCVDVHLLFAVTPSSFHSTVDNHNVSVISSIATLLKSPASVSLLDSKLRSLQKRDAALGDKRIKDVTARMDREDYSCGSSSCCYYHDGHWDKCYKLQETMSRAVSDNDLPRSYEVNDCAAYALCRTEERRSMRSMNIPPSSEETRLKTTSTYAPCYIGMLTSVDATASLRRRRMVSNDLLQRVNVILLSHVLFCLDSY